MSTEFFNDQWRIPSNENQNKVSNYSMEFDGTSDFVTISNIISLPNDFTWSAWIYPTRVDDGYEMIYTQGTAVTNAAPYFAIQETKLHVYITGVYETGLGFITANEWQHVALTRTSGVLNLYKNGVEYNGTRPTQNGTINNNSAGLIGKWSTAPIYFKGNIDQFCIFDYALSQDQITQLGAEGYAFNFIPNDRINVGNNSSLNITGDLTLSIWMKSTSTAVQALISKNGNTAGTKIFALYSGVASGNDVLYSWVSSDGSTLSATNITLSGRQITDGNWHNIVMVNDPTTTNKYLYVDGVEVKTTTNGTTIHSSAIDTLIGSYTTGTYFFNGELSNAQIFNSVIPPTGSNSVQTIYNNGKPLTNMSSFTSLQGWWKLDDTAIFNTTSTEWSVDNNALPSTYKSSLDFDGGNDYIDISSSAAQLFNNLSFSGWLNWDGSQYSSVFSFSPINDFDTANGFVVEVRTGGEVRVGYAGQSWGVIVSSAITASTWTHIAVTLSDAGGVILYKNGVSIGTNTATPGTPIYKTAFIGARAYGSTPPPLGGQYFGGTLSNIALWNTTLIASQITTLYNNGTPEAAISHSPIAWYKLNNLTTGIQDSVGSNNGTNNGAIEYAGFVNSLAGDSVGMDASSLVASNINGELIANPMATSPKPISYYQIGDQSVDNGANYLVPNNSLSDYVFFFPLNTARISVPSSTNSSTATVSFWINYDSLGTGVSASIPIGGDTTTFWPYIQNSSGKFHFYINSLSSTTQDAITTVDVVLNKWFHIALSDDGTNTKAYINGVPQVTMTSVVNALFNTIGAWSNGSFSIDGRMSNVAYWQNTNLSDSQIFSIYNNGAPNDISSLNPTAWYKLNASEIFNSTSTEWSVDNNAYPSAYRSSLDFSNDYINCGNDSSLSISGDLTISAWVNIDANPPGFYGVISKRTSATVRNYEVLINSSGKVGLYVASGGVATSTVFDSVIPINNWVSIVITIQSGVTNGTKLFLNGSQDAITGTQSINADSANFLIGARGPASSPSSYTNGKISNVSIFNTALSTSNVQTLYNNGTPEASISHSPVSWWKLDNTTTGIQDSAGSNNGTNVGATEYAGFVNGLAGESVVMDSSNLVVSDLQQTSGYSPYALDFGGIQASLKTYTIPAQTNTVTLSAWVKRTGAAGTSAGVFGVRNSGGGATFGVCWDLAFLTTTNKIEFRIADTTYRTVTQNDVMPDNTWTHVAGVANGTNMKLYINGVLQTDTDTYSSNLLTPTSNIFFAAQGPSGGNPFNGQLSNCARWNVGLTQAEVTEIYNQGVPSNLNTFSGTAPTGWWQLGSNSSFEGNDWTCLDEIGTDYADSHSTAMTNDDITNGPGYSVSGLGSSTIDIVGDAPYSTANGLSENMDVLDRSTDVPG